MQGNSFSLSYLRSIKPTKYQRIFFSLTFFAIIILLICFLKYEMLSVKDMRHIFRTDLSEIKLEDNIIHLQSQSLPANKLSILKNAIFSPNSLMLAPANFNETEKEFDQSLKVEEQQHLQQTLLRTHYLYLFIIFTAALVIISYLSISRIIQRINKIKLSEKSLAELLYYNQIKQLHEVKSTASPSLQVVPTLEELQYALLTGQFTLHYQPIIKTSDGKLAGMEALLRWEHPTRGLIRPDHFIPVCEENNFIIPLGAWVCQTACQQVKAWHNMGYHHLYVSVNLSTVQLHDERLTSMIQDALSTSQLSPSFLRLEITESQVMRDIKLSMKTLSELRNLGVQLSLDDFGTGYSSLTYLKQFSFSYLKIDKSFIQDISSNITSVGIVEAIIKLGHSLGLNVIAEGIEDQQQLQILKRMQCDYVQGYLFGKPMSVEEFTNNLLNLEPHAVHRPKSHAYEFHVLQESHREQAAKLITRYFCNNGPLTTYLALTPEILMPYVNQILDKAISSGLSMVAIKNLEVIACSISYDLAQPLSFQQIVEPRLDLIMHFFNKCSANFFQEKIISSGHIATLLFTATAEDFVDPVLFSDINLQVISLAKEKRFDFMCCAFTHSITENATLPQLINNKLKIRSLPYKDFFYNGHYPFKQLEGAVNAYIWELREGAKLNYQLKDAM